LSLAALLLAAGPAAAQNGPTGALERFEPSVPGDAMFGVASPVVGGHLVPRATVGFDFALKPLSIQDGMTRSVIVSRQGFLHIGASFALWDRLLVSADMPFALLQAGDSPTVAGTKYPSPSGPQVGDLRLGARARLYGDFWDPFQIGVGGYVFMPTAPKQSYAGDGAVRGQPQLLLGGRVTHFVWSLEAGTILRASSHPHTFNAGAGAAVVLGEEDFFQLGPELTMSAPFSKDKSFSTATTTITTGTAVAAELLIGAKIRPLSFLVFGVGAGPGLSQGYGTPQMFAVGTVGYDPLPPHPKKEAPDRDHDGIPDAEDACPDTPGVRSDDPKKNGCPPDRDGDGIPDAEDACPDTPGVRSDDPKKNGCPAEAPDRDHDGIPDAEDACPDTPGVRSDDPKKNGCPPDRDNDGIPDAQDACPDTPGSADPDPKKNGCPHVEVTDKEVVVHGQVKFLFGKSKITQTVDPVSDSLLQEVKRVIDGHPEITLIEVQGHTDNVGDPEYNMILSRARANAVRDWLVSRGIPADRLVAKGYGMSKPQAPSDTAEGRQENRRVQFVIITKDEKH
jgi:outer membrane protein OmpA-like peptidoglycan-associated protein